MFQVILGEKIKKFIKENKDKSKEITALCFDDFL